MPIEKIDQKLRAIKVAEDCINSILAVKPCAASAIMLQDGVEENVFRLLSELKMDLIDAKDAQFSLKDFL